MGITLKLYNTLSSMNILKILNLLIHEHKKSFHLFVSFISFINVLQFSMYRIFTSLFKLISKYFTHFDTAVLDS